jgi:carboxylate-amine ligase
MRVEFCESPGATLGVEWELALVDPLTGDLVSGAPQVLRELPPPAAGERPRVTHELLLSAVELVTGICANAGQAAADLADSLQTVQAVCSRLGIDLLSAGSHPFAHWSDQQVTPGKRYATLIDRTQWWGRQMVIYGVHTHVGVRAVRRVMPLLDAMLVYHPHLQALSASSPFWAGLDTGYASNRAMMFQQLPTAGLPFQFAEWSDYEAYVADLLTTGVIDHYSEIRWDLRPSPALGTLEIRVCDGLPTLAEVASLAALTHCMVVHLDDRLDNGERLATLPPWHVQENKWRSARYGLDAIIILDDQNTEGAVAQDILALLDRLEPVARRLGCLAELGGIERILTTGASYQRQRAVAQEHHGDLRAVVSHLTRELRDGPWVRAPGDGS